MQRATSFALLFVPLVLTPTMRYSWFTLFFTVRSEFPGTSSAISLLLRPLTVSCKISASRNDYVVLSRKAFTELRTADLRFQPESTCAHCQRAFYGERCSLRLTTNRACAGDRCA